MSARRIEETWTLWCKFLNDYSRFEDWLKMAERTAANPNSADVLFAVAKEELKKFEVSCCEVSLMKICFCLIISNLYQFEVGRCNSRDEPVLCLCKTKYQF